MYGIVFDLEAPNAEMLTFQTSNSSVHKNEGFMMACAPTIIEPIINWIFENTKGRFVFLGVNHVYFELEEDAMAFKLTYKAMKTIKLREDNDSES